MRNEMRRYAVVVLLAGVLSCIAASGCAGWLFELNLSPGSSSAGDPIIAFGPEGSLHAMYAADTNGNPNFYYRRWLGKSWSAPQNLPGPNHKEASCDMAVDSQGRVHVVGMYRVDGTTNTPYTVFYWYYDGSNWYGPMMLSDGQGSDSDSCTTPSIGIDRNDNLHVVWGEGNKVGGKGDIMYRRCINGNWQPAVNLTNNGSPNPYGSANPDLAVDRLGTTVHVAWHDEFTGYPRVYYTRSEDLGNTWPPSTEWVQISSNEYGKTPTIILDRNDNPNIWWTESPSKFQGYRRWTGSAWTPTANWGAWVFLDAAFDSSNVMHFVCRESSLMYRTYNYSSFSAPVDIATGPDTYKVDVASIALDSVNKPWVLWAERKGEWPGVGCMLFSTDAILGSPDQLASFDAIGSDKTVRLYWQNPSSVNYARTLIVYKTTAFPAGPDDGTVVCDQAGALGASGSFVHSGLTNGVTYYYAAFAHDGSGNFSPARLQAVVPTSINPYMVKAFPDTTPVDMHECIVTANFSATDNCIYVQDADRCGGIRVAATGSTLSVGDVVNVSGTLATRKLSNHPSERFVDKATITFLRSDDDPEPVSLTCSALGGGPAGLQPGVKGGVGLNNIGLLVKICGKVTYKAGAYIYIDDGSNIENLYSLSTKVTGVMVKCPSTPNVIVGDIVSVTGIVQGSVPNHIEWTTNRRYLQVRDLTDVRKMN